MVHGGFHFFFNSFRFFWFFFNFHFFLGIRFGHTDGAQAVEGKFHFFSCLFLLNFDFFLISFFLSSRPLVRSYRCAQAVKGGIVLWIICKLKKLARVRVRPGFSYYNAEPGRAGIKCVFLNPSRAGPAFWQALSNPSRAGFQNRAKCRPLLVIEI